uniref:HIG1 domain-containing protein n=1 Tax=Anopheles culicifacies TaxID=139723 RepID=A0A182MUH4_9DIPT
MSSKIPSFDETHSDKLARKARESPFMPIGIAGLVAVCAIGAYKYKHRGGMSTSVFLMQLRVAAQVQPRSHDDLFQFVHHGLIVMQAYLEE